MVQPPPANPACGGWVPQFLQLSHPAAKTALPKPGTVSAASAPYVVQPGTESHTKPTSSGQATVARGPCVTTTPISLPSAKPDHHPRIPHFPTVHQGYCQVPRSLCWGFLLAVFPVSSPEIQPGAPICSSWHYTVPLSIPLHVFRYQRLPCPTA